jgi:hypothetical protein
MTGEPEGQADCLRIFEALSQADGDMRGPGRLPVVM